MGKEYKCSMCNEEFESAWSDEQAAQEMKENFGDFSLEECDVVCDDCYNKIMMPMEEKKIPCRVPVNEEIADFIMAHEEEFNNYLSAEFTKRFDKIFMDIVLNGDNANA